MQSSCTLHSAESRERATRHTPTPHTADSWSPTPDAPVSVFCVFCETHSFMKLRDGQRDQKNWPHDSNQSLLFGILLDAALLLEVREGVGAISRDPRFLGLLREAIVRSGGRA